MLALLLFFLAAPDVSAQSSQLTGDWITANKSVVRIFDCHDDHLCAKIVAIGPKNAPQEDVNNPDTSMRNRPICGLTIGTSFTPDGTTAAKDGKIYDPESGKTYSAKMQADGDVLNLRGFIGFSLLGRTETWHRASAPVAAACQ